MHVVVSQAWTREGEDHAQAYVRLSAEFGRFFRDHPGYRGRRLVRGLEDRTHFTHLRFFDDVASYEACTRLPGYQEHLQAMYEHLRPYDAYPRELMEVVLDEPVL